MHRVMVEPTQPHEVRHLRQSALGVELDVVNLVNALLAVREPTSPIAHEHGPA